MKIKYDIVYHNDNAYLVQKRIKVTHNPILETWKSHLRSDIILKKGDVYFFCEEITDLDELKETK